MKTQLRKANDEIENALLFSKRLAFSLLDATIYFIGLYTVIKSVLHF